MARVVQIDILATRSSNVGCWMLDLEYWRFRYSILMRDGGVCARKGEREGVGGGVYSVFAWP